MDIAPTARSFHPLTAGDRLLAFAFTGITQVEIWLFSVGEGHPLGLRLAVAVTTLVASAALAWRRTRPVASFWANAAAVTATIAVGFSSDIYQWTNLVAVYSVAAHARSREAWIALPAAVAGVLFYFWRFPAEGGPVFAAFGAAMWVVGWLAGRMYGARIAEIQLRHERDVSLHLAEARESRLALEEERNRIARELHDIIGHTVNVMVVHAGAARGALGRDPASVRRALETIERTGRSALGELDRVLGVLRREGDAVDGVPLPGLGDLDRLASTFLETGLTVTVEVRGAVEAVPPSVGLAAYRIVQEALTNTLKHSGGSTAAIAIEARPGRVAIRIDDDGSDSPDLSPGRGIRGMTERAALHGGKLMVSPRSRGGVRVEGHLEWDGSA